MEKDRSNLTVKFGHLLQAFSVMYIIFIYVYYIPDCLTQASMMIRDYAREESL